MTQVSGIATHKQNEWRIIEHGELFGICVIIRTEYGDTQLPAAGVNPFRPFGAMLLQRMRDFWPNAFHIKPVFRPQPPDILRATGSPYKLPPNVRSNARQQAKPQI